ncbi:protein TUNICAMYCIN INDUCED 1-like [Rutidosis leptorrhynchoides]|uniref:protein TUNICAMYCIN INDUCED 1-like n=1 Tax=Rutidosis leptorrhynchoides TaxID=125765 RepID=UPI003A99E3B5
MNHTIMIIFRFNFLLLCSSLAIASSRFNLSHYIYPKISDEFRPQPSVFLKDVLGAISNSEKWKPDEFRVSKLEIEKVRFGNMQRYEIQFMLGNKKDFVFDMRDEVSLWKRFKDSEEMEFEVLANRVSSKAVTGSIRIEGPVELLVGGDDLLSLAMPWNASHTGLRRILVGEDITVEVKNAHEVSVFQMYDIGQLAERNIVDQMEQCNRWFFPCLKCMALVPVKISGPASVVAFRTRNRSSHITSNFLSRDVIELLPDICYSRHIHKKRQFSIVSLRLRIRLLERVLKTFLVDSINHKVKIKAKIDASIAFRFQLEVERNIRTNDTRWTTMSEWRTRPSVERVWFEVLARYEKKWLKPLVVKKIKPFVGVDSSAWSNFMANMSFTKLSSALVAPEALTLDVNW